MDFKQNLIKVSTIKDIIVIIINKIMVIMLQKDLRLAINHKHFTFLLFKKFFFFKLIKILNYFCKYYLLKMQVGLEFINFTLNNLDKIMVVIIKA